MIWLNLLHFLHVIYFINYIYKKCSSEKPEQKQNQQLVVEENNKIEGNKKPETTTLDENNNKIKMIILIYIYILKKMSGATSVSQKFDAAKVAAQLQEWEEELNDELVLEQTLQKDAVVLLNETRVQYAETKEFVVEQREKRTQLLGELKSKIETNKQHESEMEEYSEFVNSSEYQEYCQNLREIKALDKQIHDLLLAEQRLGRPPVKTSKVCDCLDGCTDDCECTGCPCECCTEVVAEEAEE